VAEASLRACFVIDATGRPGKIARRLGARHIRHQRQIASVVRWQGAATRAAWLHVESGPDGWWYAMRDAAGTNILAQFRDPSDSSSSGKMSWGVREDLNQAELASRQAHTSVVNAGSAALDRCAGEGWLAVGDAAAAFDPIASQGLSHAFSSANAAARAAYHCLRGDPDAAAGYAAQMSRTYGFYLDALRGHYRSEQRWSDRGFWRRRHAN
jgi:flavin-dependent dehydrogenase